MKLASLAIFASLDELSNIHVAMQHDSIKAILSSWYDNIFKVL